MSKSNDINVDSIEEDIKILENYLKESAYKKADNDFFKSGGWEIVDLTIPLSIEHLLSDYTRQKQINEEHRKINSELREKVKELKEENRMFKDNKVLVSRYFKLKDNSIPKQKIKEKIEELKEDINNGKTRYPYILGHKIDVLQELLQESKDK